MTKIKNELAYAMLDLERTLKNDTQATQAKKRVSWLEQRLKNLSNTCHSFFLDMEREVSQQIIQLSESAVSARLQNILSASTQESLFKPCSCGYVMKRNEEMALQKLQICVSKVLKTSSKERLTTRFHTKKTPVTELTMVKKESKERNKISGEKHTEQSNEQQDYWELDHHRLEKPAFQQSMNLLSWHGLTISHCNSFLKRSKTPVCLDLAWRGKTKFNSVIDYHKLALDRLVTKLHKLYDSVEKATIATTNTKLVASDFKDHLEMEKKGQKPKIETQQLLPDISNNELESSNRAKNTTEEDDNADLNLIPLELPEIKEKKRSVYPRSPSIWCDHVLPETPSLINHLPSSRPTIRMLNASGKTGARMSLDPLVKEKKTTMKRAAVRVRAVAKIKRQFCSSNVNTASENEVKLKRVQDLLGPSGILSENRNIAIDAAKSLGKLECKDGIVVYGLKSVMQKEGENLLAYECAKSLLLLGYWNETALEILVYHLKNGNKNVQNDILSTIKKSHNAQFVSKSFEPLSLLSNAVVNILHCGDEELAFNAALSLGHLCIYNKEAKHLLVQSLPNSSYAVRGDALTVLIKQMNCLETVVIDALLHQISHASCWKHRMKAADLFKFIGLRNLQKFDLEKVFKVLHELLWNHPSTEFRLKIASLMNEFGMRDDACIITLRRLEDKDESVRAEAIIALATLEVKGDKELKSLLDIFDLDSSAYVRTQVIKTFVGLKWNHPRILRALQERQKGDDMLAKEATKALKFLNSLNA